MQNFSHSNSIQINDYYDSPQNYPINISSSASNSDYYTKNNQIYRSNYHKDWSKMQYIQNGATNLNSPNNAKNSPRYPNQYDDTSEFF